jgi:hypothetical protein
MKLMTLLTITGINILLLMAGPVIAENIKLSNPDQKALRMMSDIVLHLSQFATPPEKNQLQLVIENQANSAPIRTLAQAIVNIKHHTNLEDKPKLAVIIKDDSIDPNVRNMAKILQNIRYKPSAADRALLLKMN